MTLRRSTSPAQTEATAQSEVPARHVIAEYRHRAQTVTCECGWTGGSASPFGERSPWQENLAERRPERR